MTNLTRYLLQHHSGLFSSATLMNSSIQEFIDRCTDALISGVPAEEFDKIVNRLNNELLRWEGIPSIRFAYSTYIRICLAIVDDLHSGKLRPLEL